MTVDLVIRGGTVYDGTGADGVVTDVAVADGRVVQLGPVDAGDAPSIDAAGLAVAPGFIDIHSHSDYTLLVDPRAASALHQGVTTEVVGNCGFGCFPIRDPALAARAIYGYSDDLPVTWSSAGEYFETLEAARPAVNVLSLVPNGQLRLATVGLADRPADPGRARRDGRAAQGVARRGSVGVLDRARVRAGGGRDRGRGARASRAARAFYATHTRRRDAGAADAVAEAMRVGRAAGDAAAGLAPRAAQRRSRRAAAASSSSRRPHAAGDRRRLRHAHAHCSA